MKYEENIWYGWNGGECPVHPETVVEIVTATPGMNEGSADSFIWGGDDSYGKPIIAFRVIKEHKPAREWWCVMSHMFGSEDKAKTFLDELNEEHPGMNFGQVYKVREVLE